MRLWRGGGGQCRLGQRSLRQRCAGGWFLAVEDDEWSEQETGEDAQWVAAARGREGYFPLTLRLLSFLQRHGPFCQGWSGAAPGAIWGRSDAVLSRVSGRASPFPKNTTAVHFLLLQSGCYEVRRKIAWNGNPAALRELRERKGSVWPLLGLTLLTREARMAFGAVDWEVPASHTSDEVMRRGNLSAAGPWCGPANRRGD